jgi:homospermidine synthase
LAIVIGEAARLRNFLYYGVGGAVVGLASYYGTNISVRLENTTDVAPVTNALQLAAAAGIVGGLVYWLIAGRNAGRWREPRTPSPP